MAPAVRSSGAGHVRGWRSGKSPQPLDACSPSPARGWHQATEGSMRCGSDSPDRGGRPPPGRRPPGPGTRYPPEPDLMDQDTAELACRRGAGIEVTLLWHRTSGALTVSVTAAASGASFELPVAADQALAAFHHPYAHAAARGVACWEHLDRLPGRAGDTGDRPGNSLNNPERTVVSRSACGGSPGPGRGVPQREPMARSRGEPAHGGPADGDRTGHAVSGMRRAPDHDHHALARAGHRRCQPPPRPAPPR